MFGKMDTSQYLWPITNDQRNGSRWITQKKYYHLWREITPNPDKIVEECYVLKLQALTERTQTSNSLERGEKVIEALLSDKELSGKLEEYLKSVDFIYGLLPTKLLDLITCVSEYWGATDRKFPLIEVKLRILGIFVEEALGIAEDIAKINDKIATVLGFAPELQNVLNQPTTDPEIARIVAEVADNHQNMLLQLPFCDHDSVMETLQTFVDEIAIAIGEIARGGDIQMSDDDYTERLTAVSE